MLGCKWSLAILAALRAAPCRPLALAGRIRGIRLKVLFERLRDLEAAGIVARDDNGRYPRVVLYRLAPLGERFCPLLDAWTRAGFDWELLEMVLKCKWTSAILLGLCDGEQRPLELRERLRGPGKRQIFERLAWLEARGLIARRIVPSRPPVSAYCLTPTGRRLARTLSAWRGIVGAIAGTGPSRQSERLAAGGRR